MKIYDCFMFFDEEMLLDLRLNIMNKYIDKFVITEATYMHSGKPKKLIFDINKYSKFKDKIIYKVIDNRFISERVNQLRSWGISFIHGNTLDKDLIKKELSDCDIVHHLAGITEVPRTSKESNDIINSKINKVAIEGLSLIHI